MRTTDYLSERERQDIRDAGRGHLIDGSPLSGPFDALIDALPDTLPAQRKDDLAKADGA